MKWIKQNMAEQFHKLCKQIQVVKVFVTSILFYGYETWTLLADSEKRIQAFETKCLRKLLCISYKEHKIKDWVQSKINSLVGPQDRNLFWQLSRDRN